MQRLGRAAVAVLQAHRSFAADMTARLQPAEHYCIGSARNLHWLAQHGGSLQDQLMATCAWHQSLSTTNSSSSSSSSSPSSVSNSWWASGDSINSLTLQWHPAAEQLQRRKCYSTRQPNPLSGVPPASTEAEADVGGSSSSAETAMLSSASAAVPAAQQSQQHQQQQQQRPGLIIGKCRRKNIKLGWKKLDFVLRMVRKSYVDDAMAQLHANPKKAAMYAQHALANARNNAICAGADPVKLWVSEAFVTKAKYVKGLNIMGRGYSSVKLTRYSHLNITVKQLEEGDVATAKKLHRRPKMIAPFMFREQRRWQQQQQQRPAVGGQQRNKSLGTS